MKKRRPRRETHTQHSPAEARDQGSFRDEGSTLATTADSRVRNAAVRIYLRSMPHA